MPWLLPLLVSASVWAWMLNSESGVVNAVIEGLGLHQINWLTSPQWALVSVVIANIWIGIPFNLVILYSGLQGIPGDLYEAAALDGASGWQTFWRITFPLLRPVSAITMLLGPRLHPEGLRHHLDHDPGRPGRRLDHVRHLVVPARIRRRVATSSSPAAAVGNLLIVVAFIFGLIYIRVQQRVVRS